MEVQMCHEYLHQVHQGIQLVFLNSTSAELINFFIILNLIGKYLYLCNLIFGLNNLLVNSPKWDQVPTDKYYITLIICLLYKTVL
jgi:hypothetical protein